MKSGQAAMADGQNREETVMRGLLRSTGFNDIAKSVIDQNERTAATKASSTREESQMVKSIIDGISRPVRRRDILKGAAAADNPTVVNSIRLA